MTDNCFEYDVIVPRRLASPVTVAYRLRNDARGQQIILLLLLLLLSLEFSKTPTLIINYRCPYNTHPSVRRCCHLTFCRVCTRETWRCSTGFRTYMCFVTFSFLYSAPNANQSRYLTWHSHLVRVSSSGGKRCAWRRLSLFFSPVSKLKGRLNETFDFVSFRVFIF